MHSDHAVCIEHLSPSRPLPDGHPVTETELT